MMASARDKPVSPKNRPKRADTSTRVAKKGKPSSTPADKPTTRKGSGGPRSTKRSAIPGPNAARKSPRANTRKTARAGSAAPEAAPQAARRTPVVAPAAHSGVAAPGTSVRTPSRSSPHGSPPRPDGDPSRVMELHWGDDVPSSRRSGLVQRWVKRGNALLRHLAEHGAARHEYRTDLKEGRFVWVDPDGRVSAEAQAKVLCSWSRSTSALSMAWADPLVREVGIGRIEGVPPERDDVDEEAAWGVAMQAADSSSADYLYRVNTPHAWYFLALSKLTFHPERESFSPGTPVALVRRGLAELVRAVESRAEPAEVVRQRLSSLGEAFVFEADYAYRGTDWVARLRRAGRRLATLAEQLPRPSYGSVAAGRIAGEWLDRQATLDLSDALALLEDEWALFT